MNCQIIQIDKDFLKLKIISSKIENDYFLSAVVQIDRVDYLFPDHNKKFEYISFGVIQEQEQNYLKVKVLKPQKFLLGKIVQINLIKNEDIFIPNLLNSKFIFGEKINIDSEKSFEFIPTVQIGEQVSQGQKIGYINVNTPSKENFKHWILTKESGKINKISLGDFRIGELVATIGRNNYLLGNQKNQQSGAILLKVKNKNKKLTLLSTSNNKSEIIHLTLCAGFKNLVLDIKKQFLNSIHFSQNQLANTVLVYITDDSDFLAPANFQTITFFDKYNLGKFMSKDINDLALNICETGYSVIVISQSKINITSAQYKTINGEDVSVTVVIQDIQQKYNLDHFDTVIKLD